MMNHQHDEPRSVHEPCPSRDALSGFVLGKLSSQSIGAIGLHIETCSICQTVLDTLDDLEDSVIVDLKEPLRPRPADPQLEQQIQRAEEISQVVWQRPKLDAAKEQPRRLGQYEILQEIGRGGMGIVYKALHTRLKRPVALKLLPKDRTQNAEAVARFQREMEAVGRLDHPHLVRAHDAGEAEGQHYLAMEFVDGINLARLIRQGGPLPVANACEVIRQAALGLQHAHHHGLVHRDVKPSNLMLTTSGQVKVLDLGLARLGADRVPDGGTTASGQVLGTGDFMAPEQGEDTRRADARADIYSLGCTFYFLLTGQAPFSGPEYNTLFRKIMAHSERPLPSIRAVRGDIPEPVAAILERMTAKPPEERFPSAGEVARELEPLAAGSRLSSNAVAELPSARMALTSASSPSAPQTRSWRGNVFLTLVAISLLPGLYWYGPILFDSGAKQPETAARDDAAGRAAAAYVARAPLPQPVRDAAFAVLRQHPADRQWSGKHGSTMFAVVVKPMPRSENQQQMTPAMLQLTHMLAVHELLGAKTLLDHYASQGLTDATTLRKAVIQAAGKLEVGGKAGGVLHLTGIEGEFVVGYVVSDERALAAHLMRPPALETVKGAYRDVMHQQARELMARSNWNDALLLWNHLHQRRLVSQELYLDAAQCLIKLGHSRDAGKVLEEAINTLAATVGLDFLERAGDLALNMKTQQGDTIAQNAYRLASDQLRESVSVGGARLAYPDK